MDVLGDAVLDDSADGLEALEGAHGRDGGSLIFSFFLNEKK